MVQVRALFLICRRPLSHCVFTWQQERDRDIETKTEIYRERDREIDRERQRHTYIERQSSGNSGVNPYWALIPSWGPTLLTSLNPSHFPDHPPATPGDFGKGYRHSGHSRVVAWYCTMSLQSC